MNKYLEITPSDPDFLGDIRAIADAVCIGDKPVFFDLAANGSGWGIMLTPKQCVANYGRAPKGVGPYGPRIQRDVWTFLEDNGHLYVTILHGGRAGAAAFPCGEWLEPEFVNQRLFGENKTSRIDALAIAGVLNRIARVMNPDDRFPDLELLEWREYELFERRDYIESEEGQKRFHNATGCPPELMAKFVAGGSIR